MALTEDTDHVIVILRAIDEEMRKDPEYGPAILAPLDVEGLDRFGDGNVVIRARTKTRPIQQWRVGREFNRRIKKAFDSEGIKTTGAPRTVYMMPAPQTAIPEPDKLDDKNKPTAID